jgi:hypothetical protein
MPDEHGALIILGVKPKADEAAHGGAFTPEEKAVHGKKAMEEFILAHKRGDAHAMSAALRAHHAIHQDDADEYEHPEEEPEAPAEQ